MVCPLYPLALGLLVLFAGVSSTAAVKNKDTIKLLQYVQTNETDAHTLLKTYLIGEGKASDEVSIPIVHASYPSGARS